ncbi:MAG: methyltransferase domain-containing protein [Geminicoccaceae bacterium]|nr:MAG: methyltransferase domain-containing protein [Geminicoccaceae bacterium]
MAFLLPDAGRITRTPSRRAPGADVNRTPSPRPRRPHGCRKSKSARSPADLIDRSINRKRRAPGTMLTARAVAPRIDACEHPGKTMSDHYDQAGVDRLYAAIWGPNIHYGVYQTGDETIDDAAAAATVVMAETLAPNAESKLLEVGCGYGTTARYLAERYGADVLATNVSKRQLERCRQGLGMALPRGRLRFEAADYHALPYPDGVFDAWWCQEAMVHAEDKAQVIAEAFRVLRPGGKAVVSDHMFWHERMTPDEFAMVQARYAGTQVASPADYRRMLEDAGFRVLAHHDWQAHATTHRRKVLAKLEALWGELAAEVDAPTLATTRDAWRAWAKLADEQKLSFDFFLAQKPV